MTWFILFFVFIGVIVLFQELRKRHLEDKAIIERKEQRMVQNEGLSPRVIPAAANRPKPPSDFVKKSDPLLMELAYWRVMDTIECDGEIKERMFADYYDALLKGRDQVCRDTLMAELMPIEWRWQWFEAWKNKFEAVHKWPYMWTGIENEETTKPKHLHMALAFVKVADIRRLLKEKGLAKVPTSRVEVEKLGQAHLDLSDLEEAITERWAYHEAERLRRNKIAMIDLVNHSISNTYHGLKNLELLKEAAHQNPDKKIHDIAYLEYGWDNFEGSSKWAAEQCGYQMNDTIFPPYFPGDMTRIRLDYRVI